VKRPGHRVDADGIVAAATRLFAAKGYHGTSMRDLSGELGINPGSIYGHVRDKGDLLERIVLRISDLHEVDMAEVVDMDATAEAKLREVCRRQLALYAADRAAYRVYFSEWRHLDEARQAQIVAARDRYEANLRAILDQAVAEGTYAADVDRDVAARALLGMLNWSVEWFAEGGRLHSDDVAAVYASVFLRGIGGGNRT
jgi:TetR/AcrR family transcriptional regulator, cholesterol catabolism regulator